MSNPKTVDMLGKAYIVKKDVLPVAKAGAIVTVIEDTDYTDNDDNVVMVSTSLGNKDIIPKDALDFTKKYAFKV